jgi:deferrochelatase/peroxidase EfeB
VEVGRRGFLTGALASGATALGAVAAGCSGDDDDAASATPGTSDGAPVAEHLAFAGEHQTGILHRGGEHGIVAAFDVVASHPGELRETFAALTAEIRRLMEGEPYEERDPGFPAPHTGTVGNPVPPSDLSVVVSVGASLFDDRFGLADRRPTELVEMPFLANDRLDPARTHGDLLLSISSVHEDIDVFALRQLMRATRGTLAVRWMVDGFLRRTSTRPGEAPARNLLGFKDGTANLDTSDAAAMERYVWVADGDAEPAWAAGGSYHVVRVIRMLVEFWDRVRIVEQEALIGRHKASGAPLGQDAETDLPDYASDPDGLVTPLDAHIRLANPRTPETQDSLLLRKGINYTRGFDGAGQLDQGLAFVSFQRRLQQFLDVQARLAGEPLEEYIRAEGGGFFFALPGALPGASLGDALLAGLPD